ncbi:MAG: lipocalin-like domain-containing protein [Pseudomonadota bacterium]
MLTRRAALAAGAAALAAPALSQGFAGLGTGADGFALPDRATRLTFPADHGAHPAFRIEWWYLTANLTGADDRPYGLQWTLFRSALRPPSEVETQVGDGSGWESPQLWLAHAGLTTPDRHFAAERFARGGIGQAGVIADPFSAWIDEWEMAGDGFDRLTVGAAAPDFAYALALEASGPLVFQGDRGYSVKSPEGQASHYYSQPFLRGAGTLTLPDGTVEVSGEAWIDREWSSAPLAETQDGWDWISLHLDSGEKLMGFRLRDRVGPPFTSATHVTRDGVATPYGNGALTMSPRATSQVSGRTVPTGWAVRLPAHGIDVELDAVNPTAWMDLSISYWEGPVQINGSHGGRGYLEMTGYTPD